MHEKRQYHRYPCLLKVRFQYQDGNPDDPYQMSKKPQKGKGRILDISRGGIFIASYAKTGINLPIKILFKTNNRVISQTGTIVRTGLIRNNPAEVLKKFASLDIREDAYLAIMFNEPLEEFSTEEITVI